MKFLVLISLRKYSVVIRQVYGMIVSEMNVGYWDLQGGNYEVGSSLTLCCALPYVNTNIQGDVHAFRGHLLRC